MTDFGFLGSSALLIVSIALSLLVLAYRWPRAAAVRRAVDRLQRAITRRPDWGWLRLEYLLVPLAALSAVNVVWQVSTLHCGDDSLALLVSGQAALRGGNPFLVEYCSHPMIDPIPYGLAAVSLNALAALSGTVAGVWIVWQLLALAVVPLVWLVGGPDRRYFAVLATVSILYLPNIATNIGVDNAIVPVSILLFLYALSLDGRRSRLLQGLAAFLSTARFPALFPLLGAAGASDRARLARLVGVLAVFFAAAALSFALWGWDAINIVYLGEFQRGSGFTLNLFAVLIRQGWLLPSLASAAVQGAILLALVLFVGLRRYSVRAAIAIPLLGVMSLSQYLDFHFVLWLVPVILLGTAVNEGLLLYGSLAAIDVEVAIAYLGETLGVWWPYELFGVVLSAVLLYLLIVIVRQEEARLRRAGAPPGPPGYAPAPGTER